MKKNKKKRKQKKESLDLKQEYKKAWNYLKKTKIYFLIIISIFLLTAIIGFIIPAPEFISQEVMKVIQEILEKTQGMNTLQLIIFIIINNIQTSFIGMIFGITLGIFPIFTTIINGYLLGFVGEMSVGLEGFQSLLKLLPHGIFELPAVIIALGLGLKLGDKFIEEIFKIKKPYIKAIIITLSTIIIFLLIYLMYIKSSIFAGLIIFFLIFFGIIMTFLNKRLKLETIKTIKIFLLIILPLLVIAGIIEGYLIFLLN